tara:strand:- start:6 stop:188 length:183 start_codon:yes stop_codon:yes gene_type:complete
MINETLKAITPSPRQIDSLEDLEQSFDRIAEMDKLIAQLTEAREQEFSRVVTIYKENSEA